MAELWDIYDASANKTGEVISSDDWLAKGQYHLVVHLWLQNKEGKLLIQKRATHLKWEPGKWAATGGSAISGEDSLDAVIRETQEELGILIYPDKIKMIARLIRNNSILDIWKGQTTVDIDDLTLEHAVTAVKYVSAPELLQIISNDEFVDYVKGEMYSEDVMQEILALE